MQNHPIRYILTILACLALAACAKKTGVNPVGPAADPSAPTRTPTLDQTPQATATAMLTQTPVPGTATPSFTPWVSTPTSTATWTPMASPSRSRSVTVDGLGNCQDPGATIEGVSAKIQVQPGQSYRLRLVDGCIGYGYYNGTPLYGTRLRVFNPADGSAADYSSFSRIGWGSYLQAGGDPANALGNQVLFSDCDGAKAIGYQPPYNPITLVAKGSWLYLQPDDQGCGVCGDNWGSEVVEVCGSGVPDPVGTPTFTWTPYPFQPTFTTRITDTPTPTPTSTPHP